MQRQPESLTMAQERLRYPDIASGNCSPRDFGCNAGVDEVPSCGHARIGRVGEEKIRITATGVTKRIKNDQTARKAAGNVACVELIALIVRQCAVGENGDQQGADRQEIVCRERIHDTQEVFADCRRNSQQEDNDPQGLCGSASRPILFVGKIRRCDLQQRNRGRRGGEAEKNEKPQSNPITCGQLSKCMGSVRKISPGPAPGSRRKLNASGNTTKPARSARSVSPAAMKNAGLTRLLSRER